MSADSDVFRLLPPEVWEFVSKITLNIPSLENKVNEIAIAASFPADQVRSSYRERRWAALGPDILLLFNNGCSLALLYFR
jgi:hypothetical protein